MEREKYEYAICFERMSKTHYESDVVALADAGQLVTKETKLVRRSVGEWEEVPNIEREEREKKYEYAEKTWDGLVDSQHKDGYMEVADSLYYGDSTIVRRSVGEWEEVK